MFKIDCPIRILGKPTAAVHEQIVSLAKHSVVVISTQSYVETNGLIISVRAGDLVVCRIAGDESKIQEELLAALISIQLGK